jgi:2-dehydropantoate 2-reductase
VRFRCAGNPAEAGIGADDIILLTMKSQDTVAALEALAAAGVADQPIVCMQNGVDNERQALRYFPNVYAVTVMMPATFVEPGEVAGFAVPKAGLFDIGRYPDGSDATVERLVASLNGAGFAAFADRAVMQGKYGKLLLNLSNVLDAALGPDGQEQFAAPVRAEGEKVLRAAGIAFSGVSLTDPRREGVMEMRPIPGVERVGSSSAQSLKRHAGSIETEHLNGEIALLGRLHGVPTPLNDWLCGLGRRMIRDGSAPGSIAVEEVRAAFAAHMPARDQA